MKRVLTTFYFLTTYLLNAKPTFAVVDIGDKFGYGYIKSLGEGTNLLVAPAFYIAGSLIIFYFLIGAFKYLTSSGDKEAVASARNIITHAIIGFVILMFAFLILQFIPQFFGFNFSIV